MIRQETRLLFWMMIPLMLMSGISNAEIKMQAQEISSNLAMLRPAFTVEKRFSNDLELIGFDIEIDGIKLSAGNDGIPVIKRDTPFELVLYWRYLNKTEKRPEYRLFIRQIESFGWVQNVTSHPIAIPSVNGDLTDARRSWEPIGSVVVNRSVFRIPKHLQMEEPQLIVYFGEEFHVIGRIRIDTPEAAFLLGKRFWENGDTDSALDEFIYFVERAEGTAILFADELRMLLSQIDGRSYRDWRVLYCTGHAYRMLEEWDEAIGHFENTIAQNPSFGDVYYYASVALQKAGRRQAALDMLLKGVSLDPDHPYIRGEMGRLLGEDRQSVLTIGPGDWQGMRSDGGIANFGCIWNEFRFGGGMAEFSIFVQGVPAVNIWPHMVVKIDGVKAYEEDVKSRDTVKFTFRRELSTGEHILVIWFTNDVVRINDSGIEENADLIVKKCDILTLQDSK